MCPSPPRPLLAVLLLAASLLATGCEPKGGGAPARPTSRIWTLRQLREQAATGGALPGWNASDWLTPRGRPLPLWSPPYQRFEALQAPGHDGVNVLPAFAWSSDAQC